MLRALVGVLDVIGLACVICVIALLVAGLRTKPDGRVVVVTSLHRVRAAEACAA
jgi:hypothetical protein